MANNISESISDEQLIALLQMLFVNMNNLDRLYYDMFINTTPLTLTLERYNEDGVIETFQLPNRAKDRMNIMQGRGEPEKAQTAGVGTMYLDVLTANLWVKTTDSGATGWVMLYTPANFLKGREYIAPDGDASALKGLSASNLEGGIMDVRVGGTGTQGLTGLIKGRGKELPYVAAEPGVDYLAPKTFIGCLGLFMRDNIIREDDSDYPTLPEGWLPCQGGTVDRYNYPALYNALKYTYPNNILYQNKDGYTCYKDEAGNEIIIPDNHFVLPDIQDRYLRGWDGNSSTPIGTFQKCAIPNIHGEFFNTQEDETVLPKDPNGAFTRVASKGNGVDGTKGWFETIHFSAANYKPTKNGVTQESVYRDDVYDVRTNNISTFICIYAGVQGVDYYYNEEVDANESV